MHSVFLCCQVCLHHEDLGGYILKDRQDLKSLGIEHEESYKPANSLLALFIPLRKHLVVVSPPP